MADEQATDFNAYLAEFGTRLNEIEEKQRLLKDRILLIGENLISFREDFMKLESNLKRQIKQKEIENESIKRLLTRMIHEMGNFSRKTELQILERQMKMFQPLQFVRASEIPNIVQEEIKKQLKTKKS